VAVSSTSQQHDVTSATGDLVAGVMTLRISADIVGFVDDHHVPGAGRHAVEHLRLFHVVERTDPYPRT
jgi:hypothetical protein